jgi:predicted signal transduction protein with EAL and GGDEF domain
VTSGVKAESFAVANRRVFVRELTIGVAGLGAIGAVGLADATIGDDVDFTAIYLAVIAGIAWTSRLVVANLSAVAALVASLGADLVAHPPDLGLVLVWNGAGGLAAFVGVAMLVHYAREERDQLRVAATHDSLTGLPNRVLFLDRLEHTLALSRRRVQGRACSRSISTGSSRSTTCTGTMRGTSY